MTQFIKKTGGVKVYTSGSEVIQVIPEGMRGEGNKSLKNWRSAHSKFLSKLHNLIPISE